MIRYGFNSTDLDSLASDLSPILGVRFRPHESDCRGGAYYRAETAHVTLFLQTNYDLIDQTPFECDWPERQALLYIDGLDGQQCQFLSDRVASKSQELGATGLVG
jgi:hypothetical protein